LPSGPLPFPPTTDGASLGATFVGGLPVVATQIFTLIVTVLLSYYWVLYRSRAVQVVMLTLPTERRERAGELWALIEGKVGAFVRGQFILCVAILLLSLLGYSLIGLPYAVVLAVLAGVLEAVPYVGPLVSGALAVGIGLGVSPQLALLALGVSLVVQQLESSLLVPRVMDKAVGVSPVVTLLALTAFSLLFGLLGALLAIPLAAILQITLDRWLLNPPADTTVAGRDRMAVLQYEVQELIQDVRSQVRAKADEADERADRAEEELESILAALDELLHNENPPAMAYATSTDA
jgi:predicted PurR-regulated permease PerM